VLGERQKPPCEADCTKRPPVDRRRSTEWTEPSGPVLTAGEPHARTSAPERGGRVACAVPDGPVGPGTARPCHRERRRFLWAAPTRPVGTDRKATARTRRGASYSDDTGGAAVAPVYARRDGSEADGAEGMGHRGSAGAPPLPCHCMWRDHPARTAPLR